MRHRISGRKFNRRSSQRKALFNSLSRSLLKYEQIKTTLPKAKDLRPYVEKMITLGKKGTIAGRRRLFARLRDNELVSKVFGELAQRYANRNGGYIRIVKCGYRQGDMAPMAVIELVDREMETGTSNASKEKAKAEEATEKKVSEEASEEPVVEATKKVEQETAEKATEEEKA